MLHLPTVQNHLSRYIDAGFPILYIYTYEEAKADRYIASVAGRREVLEWNGADGFVNFKTKIPLVSSQTLESTLAFLKTGKELNRKLLVIKDADEQLNPNGQRKSDKVIALLKEIARKIRKEDGGIDATVIIVSSVLHIPQELEKAFAGISSGGGGNEVTTRLFGTFLTWMQEKKSAAFVVATANDITKLPPELLRKGRFDEIFYVALPNDEERKKIFEIHLNKRRKQDARNIDLNELVKSTVGYSGADIEGVVSESDYVKGYQKLTTEDILDCIKSTHSLSEIMKEPLESMAKLYDERKFKKASR